MRRIFLPVVILLVCSVSFVYAQNLGTGLYAFGSFDAKGFDTINLGNLNTHFVIPIVHKPGRGLDFDYSLDYEGLVWSTVQSGTSQIWQADPNFGFHGLIDGGGGTGHLTYSITMIPCTVNYPAVSSHSNYTYYDSFGQPHRFNYTFTFSCTNPGAYTITGDGSTSDGSGLSISTDSKNVITTRNGTIIHPFEDGHQSAQINDSNGNTIMNNGYSNGNIIDTLGQTAMTITGSGNASSPLVFTYPVSLQPDGATAASATIYYKTYTVQTNFQCPGIVDAGATSVDLIDHITFSDDSASTYRFQYELTPSDSNIANGHLGSVKPVTGRLASIMLPTGGQILYGYSGGCNNSGINSDGTPAVLTQSTSDGNYNSYYKTYSRVINGAQSTTTVTDELQNQSMVSFTSNSSGLWYETERQVWQGSESGTPLQDRITQYNGQSTPFQLTSAITQTDIFESFNGGSQSQVENLYDPTSGLLTKSTQKDPGHGGATLTSTSLTYNTVGKVSVADTRDAAGNFVATSTYGFDEGTPTPTSSIPQHGPPTGARGNHTSTHIFVGDGTTLDSKATFYDTGVPIDSTTPNGKTQYTYDPTTQAFTTNVALPTPSSGVPLSTSASYDPQSGVQTSATGMNAGQTTQVTQYDRLLRPRIITTPDGGQTTYTYAPNQVGVASTVDAGRNSDQEIFFDGYGRPTRAAVFNGTVWYLTDTCYDPAGQIQYQSIPYASASTSGAQACSASNAYVYTHDALGRTTNITHPDGSSNSATYNSRSVQITNSPGGSKIIQTDLLGRTSAICELSYNGSMPGSGSPQDCGMDIPGTGFLTSYSYNLASHMTTITQGAQQRFVQTDGAGRTVKTSEPERGITTYSYAYNSTGLVVTRQRPRANPNPSAPTTTTTTQYDSLGRVVSISYDDGITPTKNYLYDQATNWGNIDLGQSKGQLTFAYTSGTSNVGTQFAYDVMGRVKQTIQCLPGRCGNSAYNVFRSYTYYMSGNEQKESYLLNAATGSQIDTNYAVSVAGETTGISNTLSGDVNDSGAILSNIQNGPSGPSTYQYGNGLSGFANYDSSGRLSGKWLCNGSTQMYCTGGVQLYGTDVTLQGARVLGMDDTVLNSHVDFGYDEFDRLTSASFANSAQAFSYDYDRYGNRWRQNVLQGSGPSPQLRINTTNNQVVGYTYDAAGNLLSDSAHSYTYDAEGNVLTVDGGSTTYTYDALNHRVQAIVGGINTQYAFGIDGSRVSTWDGASCTPTLLSATTYWNGQPVSVFDGSTHFQHQDGLGTERVRTAFDRSVETSFQSLPWGDSMTASGSDNDPYHFAGLDHDADSGTEHAQFRQYSSTPGRWMSPDPYDGSYDASNPQSFNRYAYVLNNPVRLVDPRGLDECSINGVYDQQDCESQGGTWTIDGTSDNTGLCLTHCGESAPPNDPLSNPDDPGIPYLPFDPWGFPSNSGADYLTGGSAPNTAPQVPHTCQQNRILNAVHGATLTNPNDTVGTSVGGHNQFGINVTTAQLSAAHFTPFNPFGVTDGYHNGNVFFQVHDNGSGGLITQGHIDTFNPASGLFGFVGHSVWDVGLGTLLQHLFPKSHGLLDPRC